jgi:hypothetical protein
MRKPKYYLFAMLAGYQIGFTTRKALDAFYYPGIYLMFTHKDNGEKYDGIPVARVYDSDLSYIVVDSAFESRFIGGGK